MVEMGAHGWQLTMKDDPGLLTFELGPDGEELEIHCDQRGLGELIRILSRLAQANGQGHEHLMTPASGGVELSEERQGEANRLLHKVTVRVWDDAKAAGQGAGRAGHERRLKSAVS
jgi:hypothetical protein